MKGKNIMKKLVSIILALAMILALNIPAFADTKITINTDGTRTYNAYKLLNVTTSLTKGTHPQGCDDTNHLEGCYNYAYTVNPAFENVLKTALEVDNETAIINALNTNDLQTVANKIYKAIKQANIAADKYVTFTGAETTLAEGHWLIADVTQNLTDKANSLVMVKTVGQEEINISTKTAEPTITKEVLDKDDTLGTEAWGATADHDVNDVVSFKLTATLPNNLSNYDTYTLVFEDNLSAAFTDASNITVTLKNGDATQDVTTSFVKTIIDNDFTLTCADIKAIPNATVTATSEFIVTYTAEFDGDVVVGNAGNLNEVTLKFSNDPYGDGKGEISDEVKVYTYTLVINKFDDQNNPLNGAGFTLYKKVAGSTEPDEFEVVDTIEGVEFSKFTWTGLDAGIYKLVESTVPAGFNKMADKTFEIAAEHGVVNETLTLISLDGGEMGAGDLATGVIENDIINQAGTILPSTGALGTMWLILGGTALIVLAAVFMITRKKMSIYED